MPQIQNRPVMIRAMAPEMRYKRLRVSGNVLVADSGKSPCDRPHITARSSKSKPKVLTANTRNPSQLTYPGQEENQKETLAMPVLWMAILAWSRLPSRSSSNSFRLAKVRSNFRVSPEFTIHLTRKMSPSLRLQNAIRLTSGLQWTLWNSSRI